MFKVFKEQVVSLPFRLLNQKVEVTISLDDLDFVYDMEHLVIINTNVKLLSYF